MDTTHTLSKLAILLVNAHWQPSFGSDHNQPGTIYSGPRQTLQPVALQQHRQDDFDLHNSERGTNTHPWPGTERLIFKDARCDMFPAPRIKHLWLRIEIRHVMGMINADKDFGPCWQRVAPELRWL